MWEGWDEVHERSFLEACVSESVCKVYVIILYLVILLIPFFIVFFIQSPIPTIWTLCVCLSFLLAQQLYTDGHGQGHGQGHGAAVFESGYNLNRDANYPSTKMPPIQLSPGPSLARC